MAARPAGNFLQLFLPEYWRHISQSIVLKTEDIVCACGCWTIISTTQELLFLSSISNCKDTTES